MVSRLATVEIMQTNRVLTEEVIALFYRRDADDLPQEWIARMQPAISNVGVAF